MDMNIQKYMAFVKAVEYGSFTKAAEILNYWNTWNTANSRYQLENHHRMKHIE